MKRICFLSGDITRSGGTEKVACQIMSGLVDEFKVCVLSVNEANENTFFYLSTKVKHISLFKKKVNMKKDYIRIVSRIRRFVKKYRVDILVDIDTVLDMYSVPALIGTKAKLVSWEHFNFSESMGTKFRVPFRKYITRFSDCVVTITKEDEQAFINYFGKRHNIVQIYNPFDLSTSNSKYDLSSKRIISVGRLAPQKGFDMLIDVAKIVLSKHEDWEWIILGDGEEKSNLIRKIEKNNLNNLKLLGRVDNVYDYMEESAIFVLTSRYEGLGLVILEAKLSKLPVVSFNCKVGPSELVINNTNGYLVNCFDIQRMADAICDLIENPSKRQSFSDKSLLDTEKYDYNMIIEQWIKLINSLMK